MARLPCAIAFVAVLIALWVGLLQPRFHTVSRSHQDCEQTQRLWDGQIAIIEYVADELTGSPARTDLVVENLREELGPRPAC